MTFKATTVFLAAMFASQVALTAVSFADGKKGKGSSTEISFKADLIPDLEVLGDGKAQYKKKTGKKGSEEKFKGKVEFSVLDVATAEDMVFEMHLARGTPPADYAVCLLRIKEIEYKYQSGDPVPVEVEAEYVVDVNQKTPVSGTPKLSEKVGNCTVGGVPGVPAVQDQDTATVFQQGFTSSTLLTGTFSAKSGDHDDDDD
jgi:hypothetical protein